MYLKLFLNMPVGSVPWQQKIVIHEGNVNIYKVCKRTVCMRLQDQCWSQTLHELVFTSRNFCCFNVSTDKTDLLYIISRSISLLIKMI